MYTYVLSEVRKGHLIIDFDNQKHVAYRILTILTI